MTEKEIIEEFVGVMDKATEERHASYFTYVVVILLVCIICLVATLCMYGVKPLHDGIMIVAISFVVLVVPFCIFHAVRKFKRKE